MSNYTDKHSTQILKLTSSRYDPLAPELMQSRYRARKLMSKYNAPIPDEISFEDLTARREELLKQLLGATGRGAFIEPPLMVDYGCNIMIGDGFC